MEGTQVIPRALAGSALFLRQAGTCKTHAVQSYATLHTCFMYFSIYATVHNLKQVFKKVS